MPYSTITPESIVADVLTTWPQTAQVFIHHHMSCVGCSLSKFETLSDAVQIYSIPIDRFVSELNQAILASA